MHKVLFIYPTSNLLCVFLSSASVLLVAFGMFFLIRCDSISSPTSQKSDVCSPNSRILRHVSLCEPSHVKGCLVIIAHAHKGGRTGFRPLDTLLSISFFTYSHWIGQIGKVSRDA